MKRVYVALLRALRGVLRLTGLLGLLDRWAGRSRTGVWVRSWLAIYDAEELAALDVPWWTFAAADRVAEHLAATPGARAFEWGSGASTVWLVRRGAQVTAVEHDAAWAATVSDLVAGGGPGRAVVEVVPAVPSTRPETTSARAGHEGLDFTAYADAIKGRGEFDLVIVDGRAREACLLRAVDHLAPGGLIVVDNVDRERYRAALAAQGDRVAVEWTRGRTPGLPYPTRTALVRLRG